MLQKELGTSAKLALHTGSGIGPGWAMPEPASRADPSGHCMELPMSHAVLHDWSIPHMADASHMQHTPAPGLSLHLVHMLDSTPYAALGTRGTGCMQYPVEPMLLPGSSAQGQPEAWSASALEPAHSSSLVWESYAAHIWDHPLVLWAVPGERVDPDPTYTKAGWVWCSWYKAFHNNLRNRYLPSHRCTQIASVRWSLWLYQLHLKEGICPVFQHNHRVSIHILAPLAAYAGSPWQHDEF